MSDIVITAIGIGSGFVYLALAGVVGTALALRNKAASVWDCDHPGFLFCGLIWPVIWPFILGSAIARRLARPNLPRAKVLP